MNGTTNPILFDERCHFYPIRPTPTAQSNTPIRTPTKTYSRASLLNRIESVQKAAENNPTEKKLGIDFREKSIKKGKSLKKEVSEKEMDQIIKSLNSLGLEVPSSQDLNASMEISPHQKEITPSSEKQEGRNKKLLIQMALIDYALRSKLPREEQGTCRFFISAVSVTKPKLGK